MFFCLIEFSWAVIRCYESFRSPYVVFILIPYCFVVVVVADVAFLILSLSLFALCFTHTQTYTYTLKYSLKKFKNSTNRKNAFTLEIFQYENWGNILSMQFLALSLTRTLVSFSFYFCSLLLMLLVCLHDLI